MGFETAECFKKTIPVADPEGTCLVDNVTALIQNSLPFRTCFFVIAVAMIW